MFTAQAHFGLQSACHHFGFGILQVCSKLRCCWQFWRICLFLEWECWNRAVIPISLKCLLLLKSIQINNASLVITLWFPFALREASKIESLLGLISADVNMPYILAINHKWLPKRMQRSPSWWFPRDFLVTVGTTFYHRHYSEPSQIRPHFLGIIPKTGEISDLIQLSSSETSFFFEWEKEQALHLF